MQVPLLDLKAQFTSIKEEVMKAIADVCESQMLCLGPAVSSFENNVAEYCQVKHAIGVSSGSDALLASLMALGVGEGDEVITTAFTFFATAGAIARLGAKPVFVDIDPDTYNIDPAEIKKHVTGKTKAIIPVHIFGQLAQMKPIQEIAAAHGLAIVEDACQSIGASQDGRKCGNFGDTACFSFYPTKNLGGFGDGGLIVTNDDVLAEKIRIVRDHGQNPRYFYGIIGGNFRLDGIQGAVLDVKLKHLNDWTARRQKNAALYDELLADSSVVTPKVDDNNVCIYHQYTIAAPKRDELQKFLAEQGASSAIFYPHPLHLQECFSYLGYKKGDLPVTEQACHKVLSLPIYPELEESQITYVAENIKKFYA